MYFPFTQSTSKEKSSCSHFTIGKFPQFPLLSASFWANYPPPQCFSCKYCKYSKVVGRIPGSLLAAKIVLGFSLVSFSNSSPVNCFLYSSYGRVEMSLWKLFFCISLISLSILLAISWYFSYVSICFVTLGSIFSIQVKSLIFSYLYIAINYAAVLLTGFWAIFKCGNYLSHSINGYL